MSMRSIVLSVGALALATPCLAQTAAPFDGVYVGADLGYERYGFSADNVDGATADILDEFDIAGFVFGGHAGYRKPLRRGFVLGVEGFVNSGTTDGTLEVRDEFTVIQLDSEFDLSYGAEVTAGYLFTPEILGFVGAGWVWTEVESTFSSFVDPIAGGGSFEDTGKETIDGFRLALGGEYAVTDRITARLKGTYHFYGAEDDEDLGVDFGGFQILAGMNFSF